MSGNKKITVVLEEYTDGRYLTRSLNSLKRQTMDDYDVIILAYGELDDEIQTQHKNIVFVNDKNSNGVKDVLEKIDTDYMMFLSTIIVPAPNTLDIMLQHKVEDKEIFYYPNFLIAEKETYVSWWLEEYSYYGVLYSKEEIRSVLKKIEEYATIPECLLECRTEYQNCTKLEDAYIYRSENPENFHLMLYDMIPALAQNYQSEKELMIKLSKAYIKQWYKDFLKENDYALSPVKYFLNAFKEDEKMLTVILKSADIKEKELEFLNLDEISDCRFYCKNVGAFIDEKHENQNKVRDIDRLMDLLQKTVELYDNNTSINDAILLEQRLTDVSKKMEDMQIVINQLNCNMLTLESVNDCVKENIKLISENSVNGAVLSEQVVDGYRSGKLGLGTIIKAFGAWFTFKIKGNGGKNE